MTAIDDHDGPGAVRFKLSTSSGAIEACRVVNAAGAWAGDVAALTGLTLPLRAEGLHVNVTEPREPMLTPMVQHIGRRLTLKQTANGTFIIGGGWPARPEAAPERYSVRWPSAAGNAAIALRVMPALADVRVTAHVGRRLGVDRRFQPDHRRIQPPSGLLCLHRAHRVHAGADRRPDAGRVDGRAVGKAGRPGLGLPAAYKPDRTGVLAKR